MLKGTEKAHISEYRATYFLEVLQIFSFHLAILSAVIREEEVSS